MGWRAAGAALAAKALAALATYVLDRFFGDTWVGMAR